MGRPALPTVSGVFEDEVLERLRETHPQYHETAYLFTLSALHYVLEQLDEPRHITGPELADGARRLAIERYGPMARTVLEFWGIHSTADLGRLVFALVEAGILVKQEGDTLQEFEGVFDFEEAFERGYHWGGGG
jgi:uncharacterized repeat protein (TIGR04138 family)